VRTGVGRGDVSALGLGPVVVYSHYSGAGKRGNGRSSAGAAVVEGIRAFAGGGYGVGGVVRAAVAVVAA